MNWWRQLKTWQSWGIGFAVGHFFLIGLFFATLHGDGLMLVVLIDLPLVSLANLFWGKLYYNSELFPVMYHLVVGSLLYGLVGCLLGSLFGWLTSSSRK